MSRRNSIFSHRSSRLSQANFVCGEFVSPIPATNLPSTNTLSKLAALRLELLDSLMEHSVIWRTSTLYLFAPSSALIHRLLVSQKSRYILHDRFNYNKSAFVWSHRSVHSSYSWSSCDENLNEGDNGTFKTTKPINKINSPILETDMVEQRWERHDQTRPKLIRANINSTRAREAQGLKEPNFCRCNSNFSHGHFSIELRQRRRPADQCSFRPKNG